MLFLAEKARFINGRNRWLFVFPRSFKGLHPRRTISWQDKLFRQYPATSQSGRINMNHFDSMLQRNKAFAVQQSAAGTLMPSLPRALPNVRAIIIGCADQ
jgi:hypothetical protein